MYARAWTGVCRARDEYRRERDYTQRDRAGNRIATTTRARTPNKQTYGSDGRRSSTDRGAHTRNTRAYPCHFATLCFLFLTMLLLEIKY